MATTSEMKPVLNRKQVPARTAVKRTEEEGRVGMEDRPARVWDAVLKLNPGK